MQSEHHGFNWLAWVQAVVLVGWVTALGWLCRGSGDDVLLGRFLRNDYWWIVYTALGAFVALLASSALGRPHQPGTNRWRSLIQAITLALPLLFLPLAVGSDLGTEAAEKRALFTQRFVVQPTPPAKTREKAPESSPTRTEKLRPSYTAHVAVNGSEVPRQPPDRHKSRKFPSRNRPDTTSRPHHHANLWNLISNPEAFEGSDAVITGTVYKGKRLTAHSFFCYRLLMVCCAADASPAGVIVQWAGTPKLKKGAWVKVQGKAGFTKFEGDKWPVIIAKSVEAMHPPRNKFLIPK